MRALILLISLQWLFTGALWANSFEETVPELLLKSKAKKAQAIESLSELGDERVLITFQAMLDARLYYKKTNQQLLVIAKEQDSITAVNLTSGEALGKIDKKSIKKVRINNKLRRLLKTKIALLELSSKDRDLRLKSAKNLTKNSNPEFRDVIATALKKEKSPAVSELMAIALALIDIDSNNQAERMLALNVLGEAVEPEAVAALNRLIIKDEQDNYLEENIELASKAEAMLEKVEQKLGLIKMVENLIYGLSLGSILLLAAIGLAITFGVMGVINMAHGEMIMLGAYTTYAVQQLFPSLIDVSLFIAIPSAFLVSGCVGILIERLVIRHLYGRTLDTLLATFGISLILQQAVRMYNANNVAVISPEWISGFWQINGALSITYNRIYIVIFSLLVLGVLALVLRKTLLGLQMRAVTQNRPMANSMGIRSSWVDALTFGLGSGIAGIAGVALSQFTNVGPNLGQGYIIDSFMVVVFGGVGNLLGTFFGAMSLGVANKFLEPYTGAVVGKILVLIFIILFIQWRPRGLFALKGRFVDD